jgi:hypothetical protein
VFHSAETDRTPIEHSPAKSRGSSPAMRQLRTLRHVAAIERMVSRQVRCRSAIVTCGEKPRNISADKLIAAQDAVSDPLPDDRCGERAASVQQIVSVRMTGHSARRVGKCSEVAASRA